MRYSAITRRNLARTPVWSRLRKDLREAVLIVSLVLPFRTNRYVTDHLIDWSAVPDDPVFQLTFPQKGMLSPSDYALLGRLWRAGAPPEAVQREVLRIRMRMNPHPAGQTTLNVPRWHGRPLRGVQHKYRETVLYFPEQGQTCHAYCTFCFRWPQFVGLPGLRMASDSLPAVTDYLAAHPEVTDVLVTGGDPLVMNAHVLRRHVEALLHPRLEHVRTIRIGTKALSYWPYRFTDDPDADALLRVLESVPRAGRHLAIMAHVCHPAELSTPMAERAVARLRSAGAVIRLQSPVVRHVNDSADVWAELWRRGVNLGCVPYYMFVERDTGPQQYFELPLVDCFRIFRDAFRRVSGLARTVRGPSMSATPGKVHILGITRLGGEHAFVLEYLQARNPQLVRQPFLARFDPQATWFDQLEPLTEHDRPFFATGAAAAGAFLAAAG